MLDTIALTLNQDEFIVKDLDQFQPSAEGLFKPPYYKLGGRSSYSCYLNPTKKDYQIGNYKPRLTLTKRMARGGFSITLRIEFSAPKLLFGNNFDELTTDDFGRLFERLDQKLSEMGIVIKNSVLRSANVSAIHYSKNIPIVDYSTCSMVLQELGKIGVTQRLDLNKTDYRNEGHCVRYHANSYEVAFYDKIKDLQQARVSEKRAIEKDNNIQRDLFTSRSFVKPLEVLRMEVRLGNRTKIKALFKMLGIKTDLTFESIFDEKLSQQVLLHYWQNALGDTPLVALAKHKPSEIYNALLMESNGKSKPAKLLQLVGALAMLNDTGMRGLQAAVGQHGNARTWQRIKRELNQIDLTNSLKYAAMRNVGQALQEFKPLRMKDYELDKEKAGGGYDKAQTPRSQHSKSDSDEKRLVCTALSV